MTVGLVLRKNWLNFGVWSENVKVGTMVPFDADVCGLWQSLSSWICDVIIMNQAHCI